MQWPGSHLSSGYLSCRRKGGRTVEGWLWGQYGARPDCNRMTLIIWNLSPEQLAGQKIFREIENEVF